MQVPHGFLPRCGYIGIPSCSGQGVGGKGRRKGRGGGAGEGGAAVEVVRVRVVPPASSVKGSAAFQQVNPMFNVGRGLRLEEGWGWGKHCAVLCEG